MAENSSIEDFDEEIDEKFENMDSNFYDNAIEQSLRALRENGVSDEKLQDFREEWEGKLHQYQHSDAAIHKMTDAANDLAGEKVLEYNIYGNDPGNNPDATDAPGPDTGSGPNAPSGSGRTGGSDSSSSDSDQQPQQTNDAPSAAEINTTIVNTVNDFGTDLVEKLQEENSDMDIGEALELAQSYLETGVFQGTLNNFQTQLENGDITLEQFQEQLKTQDNIGTAAEQAMDLFGTQQNQPDAPRPSERGAAEAQIAQADHIQPVSAGLESVGIVTTLTTDPPLHEFSIQGEGTFYIENIYTTDPETIDEKSLEGYVNALDNALPGHDIDFDTEEVLAVMQRLRAGQSPEKIKEAAENGAEGLEDLSDAELTILTQHGELSTAGLTPEDAAPDEPGAYAQLGQSPAMDPMLG